MAFLALLAVILAFGAHLSVGGLRRELARMQDEVLSLHEDLLRLLAKDEPQIAADPEGPSNASGSNRI